MPRACAVVGNGFREHVMPKIHPTAIVDPAARLDDTVEIGAYTIVESDVKIGQDTVLRDHVIVRRYTSIGANNSVDSFAVLGGEPQDYNFDPKTVSYLRIGDNNIFREGTTVNRATGEGNSTVVESGTMWMTCAHAGHNVVVEDGAVLANGAAMGGYSRLGQRAVLSGGVRVHQFTWIGRLVMSQGNSGMSCHVPPYCLFGDGINKVIGLNTVGLRRAEDISAEDHRQIKEAFGLTYRNGLPRPEALERMDTCRDWGPAAGEFREFIRKVADAKAPFNRALCKFSGKAKG